MKSSRTILALCLVLTLCTAAWAAKKERATPRPEGAVSQTQAPKAVTAKRSVLQESSTAAKSAPTTVEAIPPSDVTMPQTSGAAAYQVPWQSINGGGAPMSSTNYQVNASVGQSAIGYATSTSYQAGVGYWYGASAAGGGCSCPFQCDYDEDSFLTSLDLGSLIDVLFAGKPEITDPGCPTSRGDFDCDGFPTSLDLGGLIDHLFASGDPPCDPCNP